MVDIGAIIREGNIFERGSLRPHNPPRLWLNRERMWLWPPDSWRSLLSCCRNRLRSGELPLEFGQNSWRLGASGSPEHCWWPLYRSKKDETPAPCPEREVPSSCHVPLVPSAGQKRFQGSDLAQHKGQNMANKGGSRADKQYSDSWPLPWTGQSCFLTSKSEFCYSWPGWWFCSRKPPGSNLLPACSSTLPRLLLSSWSMTVAQAQTITNIVWRWKAWKRKRTKNER